MKKLLALMLSALMVLAMLSGCGSDGQSNSDSGGENTDGRKTITMWFWGTSDYQRDAMDTYLVEAFNNSQDEYTLSVEYRSSVDSDIAVALSGGSGPDIVYGSGPAFVAGYAAEGLFVNLDSYAEQYGWKDRIVGAYYDLCSIDGSLYSLPGGMSSIGIFYNSSVLEENGWSVPTTYEELISIMDEAIEMGMYGGLIGAKDWRYTNEWPVSMLLTSVAGPEAVYKCLTGEQKWNSPEITAAVEEMVTWYNNGYMGGEDYWNLDANEIFQLLLEGETPFVFAPLNGFQWAKNVATSEEQLDNLGYTLLPSKDGSDPAVSLGAVCSFSINAKSENPDGAAAVLDFMFTSDFVSKMSAEWPGYWGLPVTDFSTVDASSFDKMSQQYIEACTATVDALNAGNFGFGASTCFPASTYETCIDIDTVWFGEQSVSEYLDSLDAAYADDVAANAIATIPQPTF